MEEIWKLCVCVRRRGGGGICNLELLRNSGAFLAKRCKGSRQTGSHLMLHIVNEPRTHDGSTQCRTNLAEEVISRRGSTDLRYREGVLNNQHQYLHDKAQADTEYKEANSDTGQ